MSRASDTDAEPLVAELVSPPSAAYSAAGMSLVRSPSSFEGNPPPPEPEDQGPGTKDLSPRYRG